MNNTGFPTADSGSGSLSTNAGTAAPNDTETSVKPTGHVEGSVGNYSTAPNPSIMQVPTGMNHGKSSFFSLLHLLSQSELLLGGFALAVDHILLLYRNTLYEVDWAYFCCVLSDQFHFSPFARNRIVPYHGGCMEMLSGSVFYGVSAVYCTDLTWRHCILHHRRASDRLLVVLSRRCCAHERATLGDGNVQRAAEPRAGAGAHRTRDGWNAQYASARGV